MNIWVYKLHQLRPPNIFSRTVGMTMFSDSLNAHQWEIAGLEKSLNWMKIYACPDWNFTCPGLLDKWYFYPWIDDNYTVFVLILSVNIKWGKEKFQDVECNTDEPPMVFKAQLFALSGVQPDRQKVMMKGGALKVRVPTQGSPDAFSSLLTCINKAGPGYSKGW